MLINVLTYFVLLHLSLTLFSPISCQSYNINTNRDFLSNPQYTTQEDFEGLFTKLEKEFPKLVKVQVIGRSIEGRNLTVLHINNNVQQHSTLTPMVKFIGNMHGDETIGRQLLIYLAQYLLYNYEIDYEIALLINTTEIYLMPTMNPDGYVYSEEGACESLPNYIGRTNAAGVDLNRDFPDRLDDPHTIHLRSQQRQPETAALVQWIVSNPFVLSANFHGGAIVASYPYDNSIAHHDCCKESLTVDDRVFKLLAHTYANNHPIMRKGNNCNDSFTDGITNGANWYELNGGMQDFNYAFSNCFELTIELSCCKFPPANTLPTEWARNKRSLIELLKLAHIGIKGLVKDVNNYPIYDAKIIVSGYEEKPIRTTRRGEYWRLLAPGIYKVQALAFGYQPSIPQQIHVTNNNSEALRLDFVLKPVEANYDGDFRKIEVIRIPSDKDENYGFLLPTKFEHHNFTAMEKFIRDISEMYPSITRLYSIGKSVQNRDLWVMEIFADPGKHVPGVPEFKYVANMHGNEVIGKEMLLLLTKYLVENYLVNQRITNLINSTRMHFLYSMNPDGYEISKEGDKTSGHGRENANNVDLNRNFPDQYGTDNFNRIAEPEVVAVMKWTQSLPFVLSANLHGGSLVANYPYDDNENDFVDTLARFRFSNIIKRKFNPTEDNELFKHLALVYATAHPTMHLGKPCALYKNEVFKNGITNGAQWYSVTGGMQDWNYVYAGVLEITIEMGCDKFPMAAELPKYWKDNREPLIKFIELVHDSVHGFIKSSIGTPIANAMITLDNAKHATYSSAFGDYWKLALPGNHNITFISDGYSPQRQEISIPVNGKKSIRLDVTLMRDDPQHWASANDYRIIQNVVKTKYHNSAGVRQELAKIETQNVQIASFNHGENEFGFIYNLLKITENIGSPEESKFKILIMSSLFDSVSSLGQEIVMNLARHIVEGYKLREPLILRLLERSVLYLLPITENVDAVLNMFLKNQSVCDPIVKNELAMSILNQNSEKRRDLFLKFLKDENFDSVLSFTTGNYKLTYPKGDQVIEKLSHKIESTESIFPSLQCDVTSSRVLQEVLAERLTNLFYNYYNIPMFSLGLTCCRLPLQTEIASIWRKNLNKIIGFLSLTRTGISGVVQNKYGEPLRNAFLKLHESNMTYNVSRNAAKFQVILPPGVYELEINAPNFQRSVMKITVTDDNVIDIGVIKLLEFKVIMGDATPAITSISGFVIDTSNHPISKAKVTLTIPQTKQILYNFTDTLGGYTIYNIVLGDNKIMLKAEASHYIGESFTIGRDSSLRGIVFRLKKEELTKNMPRLLFIFLISLLCIIGGLGCMAFFQYFCMRSKSNDRKYYNFSLLPQKTNSLLEEDINDTELFETSDRNMKIQEFFDDEDINNITGTDDNDSSFDNDEDVIMLKNRL